MANSNLIKSIYAGGIAFALCLVSMLAGGLTWLTGAAGWLVFLALALAGGVGLLAWHLINAAEAQKWSKERYDVIDSLKDAQACIKAEERNHQKTRDELAQAKRQITAEHEQGQQYLRDGNHARTEFQNMSERAAQRGRTIKTLEDRIASDNNTWRKQVSNLAESAYKMAVHIEGSANGLPDEWQEWGAELAQDLRKLAGAGGVQVDEPQDERQLAMPIETVSRDAWATPADKLDAMQAAAFEAVPLPEAQTQPTPLHIAHQLIAKVRGNQAVRRDNLDRLCKAIEDGYELGEAITATYHRGALCVTDDMIANEIAAVKAWEVGQRHADKGWHK